MANVYKGKLTRDMVFDDLKLKSGTIVDHFIRPDGALIFLHNGWWLVDFDDVE